MYFRSAIRLPEPERTKRERIEALEKENGEIRDDFELMIDRIEVLERIEIKRIEKKNATIEALQFYGKAAVVLMAIVGLISLF